MVHPVEQLPLLLQVHHGQDAVGDHPPGKHSRSGPPRKADQQAEGLRPLQRLTRPLDR